MELVLKDAQSALTVSETTFGRDFNEALVHQVVVAYAAGARQGTRAQKTRAEVTGSGKKPWRQKGTGRARSGSIKSPIWRSGGVTFAARPQDHNQKVNKKMDRGALKSILSELVRQDRLIVVEKFSVEAPKTKLLAQKLKDMALEDVLIITGLVTLLSILPILFIHEKKEDYAAVKEETEQKQSLRERARDIISVLFRKDALMYLLYWALISFAMGLFTSYYTVFLNRNLHIDKATASLLVSISYAAIVLFMLFTPYVVKKLGTVGTICFTVLLSVPFMLIIANGDRFGKAMIPMVGIGLFMRAGLANLGSPAESSLSMMIAPKHLRPAFTSVVNFMAGIVSIVSGNFTGKFLFATQEGYRSAYYIAAALYFLAALVMVTLFQKYNRKEEEA